MIEVHGVHGVHGLTCLNVPLKGDPTSSAGEIAVSLNCPVVLKNALPRGGINIPLTLSLTYT